MCTGSEPLGRGAAHLSVGGWGARTEPSAGAGAADGGLAAVGSWGRRVPAREVGPGHSSCPHLPSYRGPGAGVRTPGNQRGPLVGLLRREGWRPCALPGAGCGREGLS